MDPTLTELIPLSDQLSELWSRAQLFVQGMARPHNLWQLLILLGLVGVTWLMRNWAVDRMTAWMRSLTHRPKWQLRALVMVRNRLGLILFAVLAWLAYFAMQEMVRWPSQYRLIGLAATIANAVVIVSFATRLVHNALMRTIVSWFLWIWVTLFYLGLYDDTRAFLDGVAIDFGDIRLSLWSILAAIVLISVLFTAARIVSKTTAARITKYEDINPTMRVLIIKLLQTVLYAGAFFIALKAVGFDLTGLAVLSGAIGVGLGFGLSKVISNLVSGVIILLDKSIKPGDVISIGDTFGWITMLTARYVSLTTRDGREFLIPNEDLITGQVVNWSHSNDYVRLDIHFGTAYTDDPHLVRKVAIDAAKGVTRVLDLRPPVCHIVGFGDSSVDYILRFWIADPTGGLTNIRGNVYLALWDAFKEHGISIPFPQREVRVLNPTPTEDTVLGPGGA